LGFFSSGRKSQDVAKERLKFMLVHDRADISPRFLQMIQADLIKVISDYMVIDTAKMEVDLKRVSHPDGHIRSQLTASIPILKVKNMGKNR
jgi:cell division topological specificity factor